MRSHAGSKRWAVVGGGLLGLRIAHRLAQVGHKVLLLEAAKELGGLASAWSIDGVSWDRHYHVFLLSDLHTRKLLGELGLEQEIHWSETRTGFFADGKLHPLSTSLDYLLLPALNLASKARLAGTILWGASLTEGQRLERILVERWLTRLSGERTYRRLWLPLLRSKLGDAFQETSAAFIWATIRRLYAARRTGLKKEMFGIVRGGYSRILASYEALLRDQGVEIRTGSPVERIEQRGNELLLTFPTGGTQSCDCAVVTAPTPLAAAMCPGLSPSERGRLLNVRYQGVVCASALLERPLAGYYLIYITDNGLPFTTVIEMSTIAGRADYGGHSLVYLPRYVSPRDPLFAASDEQLHELFLSGLTRIIPDLSMNEVVAFQVSRAKHVFPIPSLYYSQGVPPMATTISGLFLVNSAQIVHGTLNVNETLQLAERATPALLVGSKAVES